MQLSRRIWIAAVCTFAVLFGASAASAQQIKLLPSDTELIVTFNIQQMLKSEVAKANKTIIDIAKAKIEEQLDDKGIAKHLKKADFDLFRDLTSVTIGVPGGDRNPEEGFILLEGNFNGDKIEAAITEASKEGGSGVKMTKIAGVKAFEIAPKDEKVMFLGILDKKTMIACGSKKDFEGAVARLASGKAPAFKAEVIKKLMSTVNNKQSISMVATSKVLVKLAENAPQAGGNQGQQAMAFLKTMDGFSLALTIQKDIDFQLGVNTQDVETAQKYAGVSNLAIGVAKMKMAEAAKQNPKLEPGVDIVNSIRVTAQGPNLVIRGQITFENLSKLMQLIPMNN
ncbi:MAG: hypothetical protein EXR98_06270 [Gemmataceae bacterium]|nr:hypothetical protein [Gemmataceae bacterium]